MYRVHSANSVIQQNCCKVTKHRLAELNQWPSLLATLRKCLKLDTDMSLLVVNTRFKDVTRPKIFRSCAKRTNLCSKSIKHRSAVRTKNKLWK